MQPTVLEKRHRVQISNAGGGGTRTAREFRWLRAVPAAEMSKASLPENRKPWTGIWRLKAGQGGVPKLPKVPWG